MRVTRIALLFFLAGLAGCASGGNRTSPASTGGVQKVSLTPQQSQAVEGGVKQMMEGQVFQTSTVTATRQPAKQGLQVCGFVTTKPAGGGEKHLPFYIEMLEKEGKPVAERGQVGSDPSRLSKVNFMCRNNR